MYGEISGFWAPHSIKLILLKGFLDGDFECKFYKFIRPNQEQLRKMQLWTLWQESNLQPCDFSAVL